MPTGASGINCCYFIYQYFATYLLTLVQISLEIAFHVVVVRVEMGAKTIAVYDGTLIESTTITATSTPWIMQLIGCNTSEGILFFACICLPN
jgi:hypothetical protein